MVSSLLEYLIRRLARVLVLVYRLTHLMVIRYREDRCSQVVASLSYTTLLSLVPLITVGLALLSQSPVFGVLQKTLEDFLVHNLLPDKAGNIIGKYVLTFSDKAQHMTLVGSGLVFATAIMTLLTIDHSFNRIWRVAESRSLGKRLMLYGSALLIGPMVAGAAMAALNYFFSASLGLVHPPAWVRTALFAVLPVVFQWGLLSLLYAWVPNCPVSRRHALLGGAMAGLAFLMLQKGFGAFVVSAPSYRLIYGAFAALPIFLLWVYVSWFVILLGAIFTAVLPELEQEVREMYGS